MKDGGKPIALRAWDDLNKYFDKGTDVGRYLIGRMEPFYRRAVKKLAKPPASSKQQQFKKLKAEADEVYALYIRWRDTRPVIEGEGRTGYCCSCGQLKYFADLQCGHWQVRKHWGTRWDEDNSHAQCRGCNDPRRGGGRQADHEAMIVRTKGIRTRDRILAYVKIYARKPSPERLEQIISEYRAKLEKVKGQG